MAKTGLCIGLMLLLSTGTVVASEGRSVETVQALLQEVWDQTEAYTCTVDLSMVVPLGDVHVPYTGSGPLAFRKVGDFGSVRMDTRGQIVLPTSAEGTPLPQDLRVNIHGDMVHLVTRFLWQPFVLQYNYADDRAGSTSFPDLLFRLLGEEATLQTRPDQEIRGIPVFVVAAQAVADPEDEHTPHRGVFYFAQDTGILVRLDAYNVRNESLLRMRCRDIRMDQPLPMEHFAFFPPEGYRVVDLNQGESIELDLPNVP